MTHLELRLRPHQFSRCVSGLQATNPTIRVRSDFATGVGQHLLIQEFAGVVFTGQWIRCRIVAVTESTAGKLLAIKLIARASASAIRRRAA